MKKLCPQFTDCYTTPPGYNEYCERIHQSGEWLLEHIKTPERLAVSYMARKFKLDKKDTQRKYNNMMSVFGPGAEFSMFEEEAEHDTAAA